MTVFTLLAYFKVPKKRSEHLKLASPTTGNGILYLCIERRKGLRFQQVTFLAPLTAYWGWQTKV